MVTKKARKWEKGEQMLNNHMNVWVRDMIMATLRDWTWNLAKHNQRKHKQTVKQIVKQTQLSLRAEPYNVVL